MIIGQNVLMYDYYYMSRDYKSEFSTAPISIGTGTWIGSNVVILKDVSIGKNCVIGAGSIVNKDIPNNSIFYNKRINAINTCIRR
ncbi:DapH/DapD/GlmU-related protein [Anaerovibrio slackiae]|uniref:DapH/DapD/GlmU-related protein n=1 Tax=Anaerovibrio slackiae TaxID=2652309 RepID=UPI003869B347